MSFSIYFRIKCETNRNVKIFRMDTVKLFELVELVQLQRKDTKYCKSISPAEGLAATGLKDDNTGNRRQNGKQLITVPMSCLCPLPTNPFLNCFKNRLPKQFLASFLGAAGSGWTGLVVVDKIFLVQTHFDFSAWPDRSWWALCLIAQIILKITINITKGNQYFSNPLFLYLRKRISVQGLN